LKACPKLVDASNQIDSNFPPIKFPTKFGRILSQFS
jgi:hypothetical protein